MNMTVAIAGGALILMIVIARRVFGNQRRDLTTYIRDAEREAASAIKAMHNETCRFNAHEAMAPIEAGIRELLDLHGSPETIHINRDGDVLRISAPHSQCEIVWVLRHTTINANFPPRPGRTQTKRMGPRTIYGNGHWELRLNSAPPEPCAELAPLMGRLAAILREMMHPDVAQQEQDEHENEAHPQGQSIL